MKTTLSYGILLLLAAALLSCGPGMSNRKPSPPNPDGTPLVFTEAEKEDYSMFSSVGKRGYGDLVDKLFEEAISQDPELAALMRQIRRVDSLAQDSLEDYYEYMDNYRSFQVTVSGYVNEIQDTTLRKSLDNHIERANRQFEQDLSGHNMLASRVMNQDRSLEDQETLMKVLIAEEMMDRYLRNNMPDIKAFSGVIRRNDSLLNAMEKYTQSVK
ncbi:MAG: hypothetical protein NWR72_06620 [Bacteroidia bacterium]|nr:hypothetical protein [Bacteroidia bacterium]